MIKQLDLTDDIVTKEIVALQKKSYAVEAKLIGFDGIPGLHDTVDTIRQSGETFWGYFSENVLAGLISYKVIDDTLDIHRVAVHPAFFRRGIARNLVEYVMGLDSGIRRIIVSTGYENQPAVNLYLSLGFRQVEVKEVVASLFVASFEHVR